MRLIIVVLSALLLLIQIPLWLGKGGWLRVRDLEQQVALAQKKNAELKARNDKLESEVRDLKEGTGAVEERARSELGMIKDDEIFVQVVAPDVAPTSATPVDPHLATTTAHKAAPAKPLTKAEAKSVTKPAAKPAAGH